MISFVGFGGKISVKLELSLREYNTKRKQKCESGNKETKGKSMKEEEGNNGKKVGLLVFQSFLLNLL